MATQRTYEVMFIVDTSVSEEDITRLNENLQQIITDQGGTVTKQENMGRRQLAYPIGRRTEGHYVLFEVDGSGREIAELERRIEWAREILSLRGEEPRPATRLTRAEVEAQLR